MDYSSELHKNFFNFQKQKANTNRLDENNNHSSCQNLNTLSQSLGSMKKYNFLPFLTEQFSR